MVKNPIKNARLEDKIIKQRILFITGLVAILSLLLVSRLWFLQLQSFEQFSSLSEENRVNILPLTPNRGEIRDRQGKLLADNISVYILQAQKLKTSDFEETLNQLGRIIAFTPWEVEKAKKTFRDTARYDFFTLKFGLTDQEVAKFSVNQHLFPSVSLQAQLQRFYPYKDELAHVLGYVGRISQNDFKRIDTAKYNGVKYIGRTGIESSYEDELLGSLGFEQVEQNAHGRRIRVLDQKEPEHGKSLQLYLDVELQKATREIIGDRRGSIVAIDPRTGGVLAMVSHPTYDPNKFVNGIDHKSYNELRDDINRPLLNRSLYGRYAPGSTLKPVFALAGFKNGFGFNKTVACPGWYSLPGKSHRYRCWKKTGHGRVNFLDAIVQSCDVFFYRLATSLGIDKYAEFMKRFGFGVATGIDLDKEPNGLMPTREWKRKTQNTVWYPGETVIAGIGQGYMLSTPIQLATIATTLANRGMKKTPRLVQKVGDDDVDVAGVVTGIASDNSKLEYEKVVDSMRLVVEGEKGTARGIRFGLKYDIAGKTGTAQVISIAQGEKYDAEKLDEFQRDHSLFIGFAPVNEPKIALAIIMENAGSGGAVAAPMARKVFDKYLLDIAPELISEDSPNQN
jgi:penicillin-binding protein 2